MNEQVLKKDIANNITFVFQTLLPENTGTDRASPMASRIVPGKRKLISYSGIKEPEALQKTEFVTPYDVINTGIEEFVADFYKKIPIETVPGLDNALTTGLKQSEKRLVQTLTTQLKKDVAAQKQTTAILDSLFSLTDRETEKREKDLLNLSAQWLANLILWNCKQKGYLHYKVVTEGDNCNACTKMEGAMFPIVQAEPGKTVAPFHSNCNCKTAILNQNNDIAFFVDDIVKKLMEEFDFSKPWERDFSSKRVDSVSEEEAVYLAKLQSIGISFSLALEILAEMRRTGGNVSKEKFDKWGFADAFARGYAELQYKMVLEGMTIEQYEFLTENAQLSALIDMTFFQLGLAAVSVTNGKFFKDKSENILKDHTKFSDQNHIVIWDSWNHYEKVTKNGKKYAKIGNRLYSKHAVERMQPSGKRYSVGDAIKQSPFAEGRSVSPNFVETILQFTKPTTQPNGNLSYISGSVEIITNSQGYVVTIITR